MAGLVAAAGCGGVDLGADARVPVAERHILTAGSPAGQPLSLPGEHGFNIHVKQSSQNLGAAGQARGQSEATPQGKALAEATATRGGSARADFKIGHRIDNNTTVPQAVSAEIDFTLSQAIDASAIPESATLAKASLLLVMSDSHKRVVSKTVVVAADSDESTGSAATPQRRTIKAQLEPGESYDLVLLGVVEASTSDKQNATARLELDQLKMTLTFAPVATRPAGAEPKP
jgi:hypothetical protein